MNDKSARTTAASRIADSGGTTRRQKNIKEKFIEQTKKFIVMAVYLWILFFLFSLHESIVLAKHNINFSFFGLPLINALILGKVMLVAEDLHLGERFKERGLIYPIIYKSILFAIVFICFHVLEESVKAIFKGGSISESVSSVGGGDLPGILSLAAIMTLALSPFFAFRELGRVIGERKLRSLFLTGSWP
jgi:hypothetical protein